MKTDCSNFVDGNIIQTFHDKYNLNHFSEHSICRTSQSGGAGRKILKYINKIAASKYFQSATENKYIKKAMTEVSNTRLILTVEVQKLSGQLALNIPSPPSDRLW